MPDKIFGKEQVQLTLQEALAELVVKQKKEWAAHLEAIAREATDPNFRAFKASEILDRQANERSALMDRYIDQGNHEYQEGLRLYPNKHATFPFDDTDRVVKNYPKKSYLNDGIENPIPSDQKYPTFPEPRIDGYIDTSRLRGFEFPSIPSIISPKLEEPVLGDDFKYKKIDLLKKIDDEM